MRVIKIFLIVLGFAAFLIAIGFWLITYLKPKMGGISIESAPSATVLIDGAKVGKTPYQANRKPGEITLKLIPDSRSPLTPFETKLTIVSGVKTIVKREFAETEDKSAGEIISFEKTGGPYPSLAVISIPDLSQVSLDGSVMGFAPLKISKIREGSHQLVFSASGYREVSVSINAVVGYKLTAIIKLPKVDIPTPTPEPKKETKIFIEILDTPVGFLRVREEPRVDAPEVAQVKPGEKFPLIEEDKTSGWFKIEYLTASSPEQSRRGWISNQYAKKVEETGISSP